MENHRKSPTAHLAGKHLLVLNWRDIRHPQSGGAEQYMHQIAVRWVKAGARVTWVTGRGSNQAPQDVIDGITVIRAGGPLGLYGRAALWMFLNGTKFDGVIDCQNGIPFFSPLFLPRATPVVQVVHHVHQDQFATRFAPPLAAVGRFLEKDVARVVYGQRSIAAVSLSTRLELRRRLGYSGPIFVVPNGTMDLPDEVGPRDPDPTITVVSRLVPHKRLDLLLGQIAVVVEAIPNLRVNIVGDGSERERLHKIAADLGLLSNVTFHGYQPNAVRDGLLSRAWITASTSAAEGWGCSIIEANAWGVPCVALRVPGIRDSVVDGKTGWLVDEPRDFGATLITALKETGNVESARSITAACRDWAARFTWDRSAALLAGVLIEEMRATRGIRSQRRRARSDMSALVRFATPANFDPSTSLRATDEVITDGPQTAILLNGCDETDAMGVMRRMGIFESDISLADREGILTGPSTAPVAGGTDLQPVPKGFRSRAT
ncbi:MULTISPECIES: glycosyltransferase family 4 protein [unclassified Arthrobacter]|uniref:glycosyltransferase family 4 protein n=1 Tax=unclassified Arthrobacter TaxID=235627 RepID=UPI001E2C5C78|nr:MULTISPECIES: glycosyltransferase family 4 protein [unclassified Arthrobacter]MCC9144281.1 glycosyltransferase family 4 protein [Arthrobacter sp. zg-Y919]MDK1275506.1 glycosyltransferase family 4 protein [Arthrobacter sp. zg.Y919]WIB03119.1 glycosyltransferase family 4 protein [Arthrobacter sp. zg-Y919]